MTKTYTLITGASSGIGLALARKFAREKHNLILVARREKKLKNIATELRKEGVTVHVIPADLASEGRAENLFEEVKSQNLKVEILVNNAGRGNTGEFINQELEQMRGTMELNMISLALLSRLFIEEMKSEGYGHVLNIASIAGFMPGPGFAIYHATKAFVLSLSEALNSELSGTGVSITACCPGPTESEFHQHADTLSLKSFKLLSLMSADDVAKSAYQAMLANKSVVVPGLINQMLATSPKLLPRKVVPPIVHHLMVK